VRVGDRGSDVHFIRLASTELHVHEVGLSV